MKNKLIYILFSLLIFQITIGISKEILIDSNFTDIDIYNSLTNHKNSNASKFVFEIKIKNKIKNEQQLYISIINPTIDRIVIYDGKDSVVLGDLIPFTKRKFKHTNHVYPIVLKEYNTRKIKLIVYNQYKKSLNFRVNICSENTFIKTTNHDNFFNGIFYGILFMYILLLICFYIFSKNNFFIIYLCIIFFMMLLYFQYNGTGYQYMWFYSSSAQKYISIIAIIGYLTAHISFIRGFFSIQIKYVFSRYILKIFLYILICIGLLLLYKLYTHSYGYILSNSFYFIINGIFLIYGFLVICLCIYTYIESGRREIIWVLTGFIVHIISWIVFINNEFITIEWLNYLTNYKLFSSNIFVPQLNYYITMLEMFMITVFITINYHKLILQNSISIKRLDFLQKRNINTFVLGQEVEREKISEEIEKNISKDIQNLKKSLHEINKIEIEKEKVSSMLIEIDKTLTDIKNITSNYITPDIQEMKLIELINTSTDKLFYKINTTYNLSNIPVSLRLNALANINLYRILQEISNNALKHSAAENITITGIKDNKSLQIKISDDGIGFVENINKSKGIGLMNIESRMNSLNGNLYIISNNKKGITLNLIMPLKDII